ncbi:hypothetical protein HYFRA_00012473 [Hymenoscyphus fraxineus]|uniref:Uncharacterized protein n=1 Tax=Hymenoscyphus fraxineus TaxID=746836 RepID=A0A9N9L0Q6_9HELO|nr:hypothetical protein HYFRA_00012473 [Hymenoscyphus fraxineus]
MSAQQEFTATRLNRSGTASSVSSTGSWLELTHTPRDTRTSSVSSESGGFLALTSSPSRPNPNTARNVTDEDRRLFLLRARNGN